MSWPWAPSTSSHVPSSQPHRFQPTASVPFHQQFSVSQNINQRVGMYNAAQTTYSQGHPSVNYPQQYPQSHLPSSLELDSRPSLESWGGQCSRRLQENKPQIAHSKTAGVHEKGSNLLSRAVERELAHARNVLASLGRTMPGDSAEEIALYVAERKRNWPRSKRSTVKEKMCTTVNALTEVAECYGSDPSDDEKDCGMAKELKKANVYGSSRSGVSSNRRTNRTLSVGTVGTKRVVSRRSILLAQLLKDEVGRERQTILRSFEYLLNATIELSSTPEEVKTCSEK